MSWDKVPRSQACRELNYVISVFPHSSYSHAFWFRDNLVHTVAMPLQYFILFLAELCCIGLLQYESSKIHQACGMLAPVLSEINKFSHACFGPNHHLLFHDDRFSSCNPNERFRPEDEVTTTTHSKHARWRCTVFLFPHYYIYYYLKQVEKPKLIPHRNAIYLEVENLKRGELTMAVTGTHSINSFQECSCYILLLEI